MLIELEDECLSLKYINDAADLTRSLLSRQDAYEQEKEHLFVIGLDSDRYVLYADLVSIGTSHSCPIHPREVFRRAVARMAESIVLVHNHPSRNVMASESDFRQTFQCMAAGKILGIDVDASIVVSTKTDEIYCLPKRIPSEFQNLDFT